MCHEPRRSNPENLNSSTSEEVWKRHAIEAANNEGDSEPDLYSVSVMGRSFKLLFKGDGSIITMPYTNIKIVTNAYSNTIQGYEAYWKVILEDGTVCTFGGLGCYETNENPRFGNLAAINHYTSSWYLKSITSTSGEIVNFIYTLTSVQQDTYFSQKDEIKLATNIGCTSSELGTTTKIENQQITMLNLSSIESDLIRVDFILNTSDRMDLKGSKSLDEIKIYSKIGANYIEKNKFNYTYSQAVLSKEYTGDIPSSNWGYYQNRLKLNSIDRKSDLNILNQHWSFIYNPQNLPSRRSFAQDYWGFFNGAISNTTLLPPYYFGISSSNGFFPPNHELGGNREGNELGMKAEILTDIIYPTGGKTSFEYEANNIEVNEEQYENETTRAELFLTATTTPYIQYQEIPFTISKPQYANFVVNGSDISPNILNDHPSAYVKSSISCVGGGCPVGLITSTSNGDNWINFKYAGNYILKVYTNVDQSSLGADDLIEIYASITYSKSVGLSLTRKLVGGLRIKSIVNHDALNTASTMEKYFLYSEPQVLDPINVDRDNISRIFELNCNATTSTSCSYKKFIRNSSTKCVVGSILGGTVGYGKVTTLFGSNAENGKTVSIFSTAEDENVVLSKEFPYPPLDTREWRRGLLLKETNYSNNSIIKSETVNTFEFNPIKSITVFKAGVETILTGSIQNLQGPCQCVDPYAYCNIERVSYSISTEQVKSMTSKKTIFSSNGNLPISNTITNYYDNPNNLLPTRVEGINSNGEMIKTINRTALEKIDINTNTPLTPTASMAIDNMLAKNIINVPIQTEKYKSGNLITRSLVNFKIWSPTLILPENIQIQNNNYPIETKISFNSYDTKGNILEQQKTNDIKQSYLYGYKQNYPVAEVIGSDQPTIASFITQSILDNPTTDQQLINELNKIRIGLAATKALVKTYTYRPLIGVTSETDPNNRTIYYEYDNFNRLSLVRDHDNNILKKICYNYAGQPETCNTACFGVDATPNWQNNNSPVCITGINGNTGYQTQQQIDVNSCSPSYNTTRTIEINNPTACPVTACVPITYSSSYSGYQVTYDNNRGGIYNFALPVGSGILGCIPEGYYRVSITTPQPADVVFSLGCTFQSGYDAYFENVYIAANSSCNEITILTLVEE